MHSGKKIYGAVNINMPAPYPFLMVGFSTLLAVLLVYGLSIDFSAMYLVKGYLNAKLGTSPVYAIRPGIISQKFVTAGQRIAKGQDLFRVDTTTDHLSYAAEQRLLNKRLLALERNLKAKTQYLRTLKPLLVKHYVSLASYQTIQDQLNELETNRHTLKMALFRHKQSSSYVVRSPISGTISSLEAHVGQKVSVAQSLLTVLPLQAALVAQLYVPVAKSGFLQPGASIALRYDAYPFQHFGVAQARIQKISQSILTDRDEDKPMKIGEPYYKVLAYLDQPYILLYGQKHLLQQGMTCTAVISGAHKKLWRWILDPTGLM